MKRVIQDVAFGQFSAKFLLNSLFRSLTCQAEFVKNILVDDHSSRIKLQKNREKVQRHSCQ